MEQLEMFLLVFCGVMAVLSLATLHKIRKISKQIQKIAEHEEHMLIYLANHARGETQEQPTEQYKPEELIDAVLGEIFP